jgi:hypothetical protein
VNDRSDDNVIDFAAHRDKKKETQQRIKETQRLASTHGQTVTRDIYELPAGSLRRAAQPEARIEPEPEQNLVIDLDRHTEIHPALDFVTGRLIMGIPQFEYQSQTKKFLWVPYLVTSDKRRLLCDPKELGLIRQVRISFGDRRKSSG